MSYQNKSKDELRALTPHNEKGEVAENAVQEIQRVREMFTAGHFKYSGLAGPFRDPQQQEAREHLLVAVESLYDLLYLLGEVLLHFHRISDSLGDYGMIRVSVWLHPCLDSVIEKVQRLQTSLKPGFKDVIPGRPPNRWFLVVFGYLKASRNHLLGGPGIILLFSFKLLIPKGTPRKPQFT